MSGFVMAPNRSCIKIEPGVPAWRPPTAPARLPLLDAALQPEPFLCAEEAGEHIERDQPVWIAALAVGGEGDADAAEQRSASDCVMLRRSGGISCAQASSPEQENARHPRRTSLK